MKGFLKSNEGIYQLAPKVTTIGREGCDLVIQNNCVDFQHAVIEYSENEDCFVLQDLNTAQGTYVNECRVQNAAVRLAPGDIIRFGPSGTTYELTVDNETQLSYPPVHQRAAWTQPLTVITDPVPPQVVVNEGFPQLRSIVATTTTNWCNAPQRDSSLPRQHPMSATVRTRPLSAGSTRTGLQRSQTAQPLLNSQSRGTIVGPCPPKTPPSQNGIDLVALQEKEQRILRLQEECKRLTFFETENLRKDEAIMQLREEISDLQAKVRRYETSQLGSRLPGDAQVTQRLMMLENELHQKRMEVQALKDEITKMSEQPASNASSRQDINERILEINSLKTELERVKKDKNITTGLVTQMQRDMTNKDTSISRLAREVENLKREIQDKEVHIQSLRSKPETENNGVKEEVKEEVKDEEWHKSPESRQRADELEAKERELAQFRIRFKSTENRIQEQSDLIASLKKEVEKLNTTTAESTQAEKKMQTELDQTKVKLQDMERAERLVRVDLEQASKRMERFRNRVVQTTYSTPGVKAPDKELTDDELLEALKNIVDHRTQMQQDLAEHKSTVSHAKKAAKDVEHSSKKVKQQLKESTDPKKKKAETNQ